HLSIARRDAVAGGRRPAGLDVKSQEVVHPGHLCDVGGCESTITAEREARMDIHKNARTTPHSRAAIVQRITQLHESIKGVARAGLARLRALEPVRPVQRYERARPGELLHLDVKKLARIGRVGHRITGDRRVRTRGLGWEYVHVAVDDASRLSYTEVLPDERGSTVAAFLWRALAWYRRHGIRVQRVMTDNAFAYLGHAFQALCELRGIRHLRIRPYTPRTNGKAERFIQTLLREWAYVRPYRSSRAGQALLPRW